MILTTLKASLTNFILPNRCPGCGAFLTPREMLCPGCEEKILLRHDDYCHVCGKIRCQCKTHRFGYDSVVLCARYSDDPDDPAVRAVWALKNSRNTNLAEFSAEIIARRLRHSLTYGTFDCVTAVPMHRSKQRLRGYNQAALIGKALAARLELPYREDMLFKTRTRQAQHNLSAAERTLNVSSFGAKDCDLTGMRILLCDDVLTTGATMSRCAELLHACGASYVTAAVIATTFRLPAEIPDSPQP